MKGIPNFAIGRNRLRVGPAKPGEDGAHSPARAKLSFPGAHHTWMAVLLVVLVGRVEEWVPGLVGLPLAKVAFLLTAFYAYRERRTLIPVRIASLRVAKPFLAFFALSIFSMVFSIYKSATLQWIFSSVVLLLTFFVLVKITQTLRDVERMMLALAASAILLALGVLLNYRGGRAHINSNFDPNDVAYSLDTLLPVVIAVGVAHSKRLKWIALGMTVPIACAILLTGSLGGVIGFGVVVAVMILYPLSVSKTGELRNFSLSSAILTFSIIAALGVSIWGYLPTTITDRLSGLGDMENNYNAGGGKTSRLVIWQTQVTLAIERPIGYGMGTAASADGRLGGGAYFTSHNSFVQAFIELGALGLWLFLYTYYIAWKELGVVLRKPHRALFGRDSPKAKPHRALIEHNGPQAKPYQELIERDRPKAKPRRALIQSDGTKALLYARGLRIALIGNAAAGFFLSEAYSSTIWMIVAVCAAFVRVTTLESREPSVAPSEPSVPISEQNIATQESPLGKRKSRAAKRALRMNRSTDTGGRRER